MVRWGGGGCCVGVGGGWRRALTGPGASLLSAAIYFITLRASTFGNPWSELPFAAKTPIGRGNVIYTELRTLQWREIGRERERKGGREWEENVSTCEKTKDRFVPPRCWHFVSADVSPFPSFRFVHSVASLVWFSFRLSADLRGDEPRRMWNNFSDLLVCVCTCYVCSCMFCYANRQWRNHQVEW